MNILIDAHMLGERETGNETYTLNLIRGLRDTRTQDLHLIVAVHDRESLPSDLVGAAGLTFVNVSRSSLRRLLFDLGRLAHTHNADLMHVTYTGPLWCPCPVVVTVHDVSYKSFPQWFSLRDRLVLNTGVAFTIRHSRAIITISRYSQEAICKVYRCRPGDVHAIPLAPPLTAAPSVIVPPDPDIRHPYVLAVGTLQPRKNIRRLIQAFARTRREHNLPHELIVVGPSGHRADDIHAVIDEVALRDQIHITGYVSDERLQALYRQADCFAYPSLHEGFGLPVLEAMQAGTPVLTSNTTSIPEVAGDAAVLVDPTDGDAIAAGLAAILTDHTLRDELRAKGRAQAARFTWQRTASETVAVYRSALV